MVDIKSLTKPPMVFIVAGAAVLGAAFITKGNKVVGVDKKILKIGGAGVLAFGLYQKYVKKNGNGGGGGITVLPSLPPGATPVPQFPAAAGGPMVGTGGVALNTANPGPTMGPTSFPGPILTGRTRALLSTQARKSNYANANTLGMLYGSLR